MIEEIAKMIVNGMAGIVLLLIILGAIALVGFLLISFIIVPMVRLKTIPLEVEFGKLKWRGEKIYDNAGIFLFWGKLIWAILFILSGLAAVGYAASLIGVAVV